MFDAFGLTDCPDLDSKKSCAFGGGALLAALVIDLVGSAREKGHILELVIGSIIGSLFLPTSTS